MYNSNDEEDIDDLDLEEVLGLLDKLEIEASGDISDAPVTNAPKSRLEARKWTSAFLKLKRESEWLKDEYIPHLIKKYIEPQKTKMAKIEENKDAILSGLKAYLESNEEDKKVSFPDLGTVYMKENPAKIMYPEDEEEFAESLVKAGNMDYIATVHKIDKKKINQEFKDTGAIPINGLTAIDKEYTACIRKVSEKKIEKKD